MIDGTSAAFLLNATQQVAQYSNFTTGHSTTASTSNRPIEDEYSPEVILALFVVISICACVFAFELGCCDKKMPSPSNDIELNREKEVLAPKGVLSYFHNNFNFFPMSQHHPIEKQTQHCDQTVTENNIESRNILPNQ